MSRPPILDSDLQAALDQGRLFEWLPLYEDPDQARFRRLLMSDEAMAWCPGRGSNRRPLLNRGGPLDNTRAMLTRIVTRRPLVLGVHLKRLDPPPEEIWEIRVTERPQIRLFGWFAAVDVFIVCHLQYRDKLPNTRHDGPGWRETMEKAARTRSRLFSDLPIRTASKPEHYFTNP